MNDDPRNNDVNIIIPKEFLDEIESSHYGKFFFSEKWFGKTTLLNREWEKDDIFIESNGSNFIQDLLDEAGKGVSAITVRKIEFDRGWFHTKENPYTHVPWYKIFNHLELEFESFLSEEESKIEEQVERYFDIKPPDQHPSSEVWVITPKFNVWGKLETYRGERFIAVENNENTKTKLP